MWRLLEYALGIGCLVMMLAGIVAAYHFHMREIWADIAAERAEELADEMFTAAVQNAQVRVKQRLVIRDEMERGKNV